MAKIAPFRAIRPPADKVSLVTTRSYDEYSPAELASQLDFNPFSFLHVLNPAYAQQQKIGFEKRFKTVAQKYRDFREDGVLEQEETPVLYLYEIQARTKTFTGIIAATALEDYRNGVIKKHEDTLPYRVELFKDYLHHAGFNTEPVLITYPRNEEVARWMADKKKETPLYSFSTTRREKHTLWTISAPAEIQWLQCRFEEIGDLYIADGHHRSASADLLYQQDGPGGHRALSHFMSFLVPGDDVLIFEYNRMVRDLNGHSKADFLALLGRDFWIKEHPLELWKPTKKFEYGMYLDGVFYSLLLKDEHSLRGVLERLDAQVLYEKVLHPILGIEDLRNDERIDYIPGTQSVVALKEIIDEDGFEVGFTLFPATVAEIMELADNGLIMPPKSTYIEPKFRSGLVVYEL